jgi:hypothetical protein
MEAEKNAYEKDDVILCIILFLCYDMFLTGLDGESAVPVVK